MFPKLLRCIGNFRHFLHESNIRQSDFQQESHSDFLSRCFNQIATHRPALGQVRYLGQPARRTQWDEF
jgi:hypothetical protein